MLLYRRASSSAFLPLLQTATVHCMFNLFAIFALGAVCSASALLWTPWATLSNTAFIKDQQQQWQKQQEKSFHQQWQMITANARVLPTTPPRPRLLLSSALLSFSGPSRPSFHPVPRWLFQSSFLHRRLIMSRLRRATFVLTVSPVNLFYRSLCTISLLVVASTLCRFLLLLLIPPPIASHLLFPILLLFV